MDLLVHGALAAALGQNLAAVSPANKKFHCHTLVNGPAKDLKTGFAAQARAKLEDTATLSFATDIR
jgi:hypothetical protein